MRGFRDVAGTEKQNQIARLQRRAQRAHDISQGGHVIDRLPMRSNSFGERRAIRPGDFRLTRGIDFGQEKFVRVGK